MYRNLRKQTKGSPQTPILCLAPSHTYQHRAHTSISAILINSSQHCAHTSIRPLSWTARSLAMFSHCSSSTTILQRWTQKTLMPFYQDASFPGILVLNTEAVFSVRMASTKKKITTPPFFMISVFQTAVWVLKACGNPVSCYRPFLVFKQHTAWIL